MNNFDYKNLTPFKWFVLENFPFIENDFDAINNYHLFSKVVEYLNKTIDSMNLTGEQMENVTNAMTELQNYVNNYFDNLDVQEEINNKLDEMVEDGTLQDYFDEYFDLILKPYFVVCGDSWSDGNNDENPWVPRVAEYNNMRAINQAIAGTGFATGTTFAQQVLNAKTYCDNNNIDVENVKYIIAYGGVNDYRNGRTISEVNTGFDTFMVNAHTNFPNSKIIVVFSNTGLFNTWDTVTISDPNARSSYQEFPEWNEEITSHMRTGGHCQVISDSYLWLNVYGQDSTNKVFKADRLHPQAIGQRVIAQYMLQILNGSYSGVHKMLGCGILENGNNSNIKLTYNISLVGNQIVFTGKIPLNALAYTPATNENLDFTILGPSKRLFTMANLFNEMTVKVTDFSQNHPNNYTILTGDVKAYLQLSTGRLRLYLSGGERYGDLFLFGATSIG